MQTSELHLGSRLKELERTKQKKKPEVFNFLKILFLGEGREAIREEEWGLVWGIIELDWIGGKQKSFGVFYVCGPADAAQTMKKLYGI